MAVCLVGELFFFVVHGVLVNVFQGRICPPPAAPDYILVRYAESVKNGCLVVTEVVEAEAWEPCLFKCNMKSGQVAAGDHTNKVAGSVER